MKVAIYSADWNDTDGAGNSIVKYAKGKPYPLTDETAGHIAQGHAVEAEVDDDPVTAADKAARARQLADKAVQKAQEAEAAAALAEQAKETARLAEEEEAAEAKAAAERADAERAASAPESNLFQRPATPAPNSETAE
ncbi:hypothetical protein [Rhodoferax sp. GW822-FHT02A01]|uniref:hypothetical protein n=1 Tax=Rhodoferax sp. GW822-FHT02A01 TaxID=3141537 RepID=UPI00315D162E